MTRNDDERIADILDAGATLGAIVAGGETSWHDDEIRRLAAERLLEIIGESARAMSEAARSRYPQIAWSDISDYELSSPTTTTASTPPKSG